MTGEMRKTVRAGWMVVLVVTLRHIRVDWPTSALYSTRCIAGNTPVVTALLASGVAADYRIESWSEGSTPLQCAVQGAHKETIELLLATGASIVKHNISRATIACTASTS